MNGDELLGMNGDELLGMVLGGEQALCARVC
jgi:hypothetical protein